MNMIIFIILGGVVLVAAGIVGFLFYLLNQQPVEPVTASFKETPEMMTKYQEQAQKEALYHQKVLNLESELKGISQKAQEQSKEALDAAEVLKKENEELKAERNAAITMAIEQLKSENEKLRNEKAGQASDAHEGVAKAQETIDVLHQDQSLLQGRLVESHEQVQKLQEEIVAMKQQMGQEMMQGRAEVERLIADNQKLQESLSTASPETIKTLQEGMDILRQEIHTLQDVNSDLNLANKGLKIAIEAASPEMIQKLKEEVGELKNANNDLILANQGLKISLESASVDANHGLQEDIENLKAENVQLNERLEDLQFELTKARAQTTSFERACENYQVQLKEALERKGSNNES